MSTLHRLLRMLGPLRWQIAGAVLLGAATVAGGVGLMGTAAYLIASAALQPSIAELQVAIVGVRFFGLSRGVFRYLERLVSHGLALCFLGRLRVWFFRALEPLAPARTIELGSADLLSRAVADVESLQKFLVAAVAPPMVAVVIAVWTAPVIGIYAPELAWVFLGAFAATAVVIPLGVLQLGRVSSGELVRDRAELASTIGDGIQGMADLLAFGRGEHQSDLVDALSQRTENTRRRSALIEGLGGAGVTMATHLSVWLVLIVAIPMVGEGRFTGVGLAVVCLVVMAAFEAVQPLPAAARGLAEQIEAAKRVFAVLDTKPVVDDLPDSSVGVGMSAGGGLGFRRVAFAYPGENESVLGEIDLEIGDGRRFAIVGPSGAGKSTIAHLLLRFWDPTRGEIRLGDHPLGAYPLEELRSIIGLLPQRTELFTGTIRENLLLAGPLADQNALDEAARRAGLLEDIRAFPDGWETWIGEHGMQLSGGQRRRLAIARLVLRNPLVAVLDEPTSGLDPVTEAEVMESLLDLFAGRTTVVITHRLVEMGRFDEILVLDRGSIVERGVHDELVRAGGLYRQLYDAQHLELAAR